jgi:glucose/arabinose dehydrogenase
VAALALALGTAGLTACETAPPTLTAQTLVGGLSHPWGLSFTPSRSIIWTERGGRIMRRRTNGAVNQLAANLSDLRVSGETGLMGVAVDPRFNANRRIYTCQGWTNGSSSDVRVIPWVANGDGTALARQAPIVTGLPASSGRHGGCRLRFDSSNRLYVGTGDAAIGTTPQSLTSMGGKVLRVDPDTGAGVAGNPFASSGNAVTRRIWSYGHRNVQGLAFRPADGLLWSAEHGPDRDDELNRIRRGGNHGWDPVPGYNEAVPMTDTGKYPDAVRAPWSSGVPTVATSGITWLDGAQWEGWDDRLVVATLKGESLLVMRPEANGTMTQVARIYQGSFGRIRTAQLGPDGLLYITTSNGSNDRIIRITPS